MSATDVLVPVIGVAFAVAVAASGWRLLRTWALDGAREAGEYAGFDDEGGYASPYRGPRRRPTDWSELVLVVIILANIGALLLMQGPASLVNIVGLLVAGYVFGDRLKRERVSD